MGSPEDFCLPHHHTPDLTPDQRRREVARLLATGLLRFSRRVLVTPSPPSESVWNSLDECGETRPHGTTAPPVNAGGDRAGGADGGSTYE